MIELTGINRIFTMGDQEVRALNNIDLSIDAGEYLSVMGPSGSGKSTLLNIIGLLDQPSSGSYRPENRDVTALSESEQARSGASASASSSRPSTWCRVSPRPRTSSCR
jgi:putative ABC transport system ATP-binding protein